jgi:Ca-activated chloride channel family protein
VVRLAAGLVMLAIGLAIGIAIAAPTTAHAAVSARSSGMFGSAGALPTVASKAAIEVRGPFAEVVVTQTFRNDLDRGIEAVYVFPLPGDAAVRSMTIKTGDRTITAKVAARDEARRAYEQAVADGQIAALTEAERANVFTQQVTGIEAGAEVAVELRFDMTVGRWRDGWELVLPLVVAPRHVPGEATGDPTHGTGTAPDTDVVDDASRVTPPVRGDRGGNPITVAIDLGDVAASGVEVTSHDAAVTTRKGRTIVRVEDARSDRDLVVRWPGQAKGGARALAERAGDGGAVALIVEAPPPAAGAREKRRWILVLDASGSMDGDGIALLRGAAGALIDEIGAEGEPVAIVGPSGGAPKFRKGKQGLALARKAIAGLEPSGGTDLGALLGTALAEGGADLAIVVITDGLIADDEQVAALVAASTGEMPRVHAVGVGAAPNRWLLDELARRGRGVASVLTAGEDVAAAMADLAAAARAPTAALKVDWGGLGARDVAPATLPELAAGRSLVIAARFDRVADATIEVRAGAGRYTADVRSDALGKGRVVTRRWARARVDELLASGRNVEPEVTRLGLDHELVTPYTALVARGEQVTVKGGVRTTVAIPVAMPAGMRWQAVFGPGGDAGEGLNVLPEPAPDAGATQAIDRRDADDAGADEEAPMAAPGAPASGDYLETESIMVSGRVVMDRPWTGSLSLSTGLHVRGEDRGTQVNLSAGAYRRIARTWKVGVSAKLQVAPAFTGGTDAAAYLAARKYLRVGATPVLAIDLGAGPSLDTAGLSWRAALRLGPWPFAPVLSVDQTWTPPSDEPDAGWSPRTSVGIGLDWAF